MARGKRNRWMREHVNDLYVKQAQKDGYRSRAVYKLIEIDEKNRLFQRNMQVIELGAAPGGWTQYAAAKIGCQLNDGAENEQNRVDCGNAVAGGKKKHLKQGMVLAVDVLPMEPVSGVRFIQGDFTEEVTLQKVMDSINALNKNQADYPGVDLVMSDMAPNISGMNSIDQPRAMYLAELAVDLAYKTVRPGGSFLVKLFQGAEFDQYIREIRANFKRVKFIKPKASRARSREVYLLAQNHKSVD